MTQDKQKNFYAVENEIHVRAYLELQKENVQLQSVNAVLHRGLTDYGRMVDELRDMVASLQQEIARLASGPQWERERDCYDINDEYTN